VCVLACADVCVFACACVCECRFVLAATPTDTFGPELGFGHELSRLYPNRALCVVKVPSLPASR